MVKAMTVARTKRPHQRSASTAWTIYTNTWNERDHNSCFCNVILMPERSWKPPVPQLSLVFRLYNRTGSNLLDQFYESYLQHVFNITFPHHVGGPDMKGQRRFRRTCDGAAAVSLDDFMKMMPSRVETQMRWDWDLIPAMWILWFATQVNLGVSLSTNRMLQASAAEERNESSIGAATAKIYDILWNGEYLRQDGAKVLIPGDVTKILQAVG